MKHLVLLFFTILPIHLYSQNGNLICHYKFDNNVEDCSSYKQSGTIMGNVVPAPNRFGIECTAYEFDGQTGYIQIDNNAALQKITNEFTITVWAKLSPASRSTWFTICCKSDSPNEFYDNPHFRFQLSNSQVSVNTEYTSEWTETFQKNKWFFLAVSVSSTNKKVYIDGLLKFNKIIDNEFEVNSQPLLIGRDIPGSDEFFHGTLDDLRIYNKALSSSEIEAIYENNTDSSLQSPCAPPPLPTDTIPVTVHCDDIVNSGGNEISTKKMDLGKQSGKFTLEYNMYTVPDKLTIFSASDNSVLFSTNTFVSGRTVTDVPYNNTQFIVIKVEGNNEKNTKWNYKIICD